ncbi:MAG: DUF3885 domain-containing protein [Beijerinckiaceae bacterium]
MSTDPALTAKDFMSQWRREHPDILPIKDLLNGRNFPNRWMRIHSLPQSKRYAETPEEWAILLHRQNTLIDHLVPHHTPVQFVVNWIEPDSHLFKAYDPVPLGVLQEGEGEPEYDSYLLETTWENHSHNPILIMIADESLRGFFIAPDCVIAPYDGGVDVIVKEPQTCYALKHRFKDWLSARPDGL